MVKHYTSRILAIILLLVTLAVIGFNWINSKPEAVYSNKVDSELSSKFDKWIGVKADSELVYSKVIDKWNSMNFKDTVQSYTIDASHPTKTSAADTIQTGSYEGEDQILLWKDSGKMNWIEYRIEVGEEGLYEILVDYIPIKGQGLFQLTLWDIAINGSRPFREASSITLNRIWKDVLPIVKNIDGDEIRPKSIDASQWTINAFSDSGGAYAKPLKWHFIKGMNTIRISGNDPVALKKIMLVPPRKLKTYQQVSSGYPDAKAALGEIQILEAEHMEWKNDTSVKMYSDSDIKTQPPAEGRIVYNTVGGRRWAVQNQEIAWSFETPETGLYKIAIRELQNQISQKASFRTIKIDGEVPFEQFLHYRFPYAAGWQGEVIGDEKDKPYLLYLEKGKHTLSMAVTHDPVEPVIVGIEDLLTLLNAVDKDLRSLIGLQVDKYRTWNVEKELPSLTERLALASDKMSFLANQLIQVNEGQDTVSKGLMMSARDLLELLKDVNKIPYHADEISSMNEKLGLYIDSLIQQPLQIDEIFIASAEQSFPKMKANWLGRLKGSFLNFYYSFSTKNSLSNLEENVLNVWVQRGRDYVDQLQQLADESFTPESGIKVKVNLLPNPQLLVMSNAAGIQPDVALGLTQDLPVDYAIRGSVYDLSRFADFQEIYPKFSPGSWLPLYYQKGYYAVPETQSFQVLFYRKDILDNLGLQIPQTWDDVYKLLPVLQQNSMNFYINPSQLPAIFYQNSAEFYSNDGLKTALDMPNGYKAFNMWVNLFNLYAMPSEVPSFYQHFRDGTIPIGVSDYNMYVQLTSAAPELNGRWGIALIPGIKQPDGTISRWAGGNQTAGVIFKASPKKEQAWKFLKWWISTDVQEQYGSDLEAVNGVAFRWNTSNVEAFTRLPWKKEDANVILEQWKWYKDIPNVPGGYFLQREIQNAWNRAVITGVNDRASLEIAVMDINRELLRKQQEFGFVDESGQIVKKMELPIVDKPWEGAVQYVK